MTTSMQLNILILTAGILALGVPALAKDISVSWKSSNDPAVIGYRIYYRADSPTIPYDGTEADEGPSPVDVGNVTGATLHFSDDSRIYYYAVTAYDAANNESDYALHGNSEWAPVAIAPQPNAITGTSNFRFIWTDPPSDFRGTYTLYYSPDPTFALAPPPTTGGDLNFPAPPAWPGVAAALFLLWSLAAIRRPAPRRALALLTLSLCLASCGGGGGGSTTVGAIVSPDTGGAPQLPPGDPGTPGENPVDPTLPELPPIPGTRIVAGLQTTYFEANDLVPGHTYYWKVIAHDGGTDYHSAVYAFTAQ